MKTPPMGRFGLSGHSRVIHLSVDDVGNSLRWLCCNHPESVWDMRFFGKLLEFHVKYEAKFTLYCFYNIGSELTFSDISAKYAKEFASCSAWLKFAFHSRDNEPFLRDMEWVPAFEAFSKMIGRFGIGGTDILRLHYWKASRRQKHILRSMGVSTLLYPYEDKRYVDGKYHNCGIIHRKTNICFEKMVNQNFDKVSFNSPIVAFTHEKYFEQQARNIEIALRACQNNGYAFFS
jgi:hypothetical protein